MFRRHRRRDRGRRRHRPHRGGTGGQRRTAAARHRHARPGGLAAAQLHRHRGGLGHRGRPRPAGADRAGRRGPGGSGGVVNPERTGGAAVPATPVHRARRARARGVAASIADSEAGN